ncbi:hypothetical protein Misp01_28190 [Microtetraspora sp. NBRC 13810]|uniref:DUF1707 SHOCT-like domain-containing protein n=1 Tax=Microtetraspora sp. NBRC 13810 TaxID=3030990 RepID=UPI0024A42D9D|nr:DUF1707 domain-containing protein [Microtetraspora sp. NBRC 13810]GLW07689.1 hypothetical protein Misp01_28190 [Microtetraspora sp. NBRC 13810]
MTEPGGIRASDAEREAVVERLKIASVEGRLTLGELTERTEAAYTAVTRAELDVITSDIPRSGEAPAPVPGPRPQGAGRRWFVGVLGDSKRRGKWRVDRQLGAVAVMGDVVLDLREAEVRTGEVDIVATAVMGDVKIIVPDGVEVDLQGMAIMGGKRVEVDPAPLGMNVPVIRVHAYAVMGDVKVIGHSRAEPLKRAWAAWRQQWHEVRRDLGMPLPPQPYPVQPPGPYGHAQPHPQAPYGGPAQPQGLHGQDPHGRGHWHGHGYQRPAGPYDDDRGR